METFRPLGAAAPAKAAKFLPAAAVALLGGVFVLYAAAVVLAGGSAPGLVLYPLAFLLAVWLPGLWLCRLLLPGADAGERAVVALPLGCLMLLLVFSALGWFLPAWACALPGAVAGAVFVGKGGLRRRALRQKRRGPGLSLNLSRVPPAGWGLALLFAAGLFLFVWVGVFSAAKPQAAGNMVYNQDMLWSVGNAAAARYGMPVQDLRAAGGVLHYHYLTDILCGFVAALSGQSAWDAACFYSWPLFFAGLLGALFLVSRRFGARGPAALLAPAGALLAHFAWDASFKHIFQNVNGVLQSYQFLAAAVLVLQIAGGEEGKNKRSLAAFCLTLAALLWGKSTVGLLLVCAVLAAFAVKFVVAKKWDKWLLAAGLVGAATFGALYVLLYRHAVNNLVLQPTAAAFGDALRILFTMYLPGLVLYAASARYSLRDFKSLTGAGLVVNALVPGGILAYGLFYHYSFSQSYFLLAASFAMWLCVARVAGRLWASRLLRWGAVAACVVGLVFSLYYAAPTLRRGAQVALRCAGLRPTLPLEVESVTPDDAAAAAWLRQNMPPNAVFATNRNAKNPAAAEGVFHYYTAASGRRAYVESWRYAMDYSMEYHRLRYQLEAVSDGIFAAEAWAEARALAAENDIGYLLVYLPGGGHPFAGGQPVLATDTVLVYRV